MKVSILNVLQSSKSFNKLVESDEIPSSLGFKLVNAMREIKANLETYNTLQQKIAESCAVKDADGKPMTIPGQPNMIPLTEEGQVKLKELQETEFELKLDKFKLPEGVKLSPKDLMVLDWLITE